jgi:hypothetical protein
MWTDPGNIEIAHRHMNVIVDIGAEAAQFPEKEYINGIAVAIVSMSHIQLHVENYPKFCEEHEMLLAPLFSLIDFAMNN